MITQRTKYESDSGSIHTIRKMKDASGDFTNTAPTGAVDSDIKVKVSKSNRAYGIRPRKLRLYRVVSYTAPNARDVILYTSIPVLTKAIFDGTTAALEATVKVQGIDWKVLEKVPEDY